jgi:hypothetical protein
MLVEKPFEAPCTEVENCSSLKSDNAGERTTVSDVNQTTDRPHKRPSVRVTQSAASNLRFLPPTDLTKGHQFGLYAVLSSVRMRGEWCELKDLLTNCPR